MPNFLRLTDKLTGEQFENRGLITVDEKLCAALEVPCNDKSFYMGWVDWWCLYSTNDWNEVRRMEKETGFDPDYYEKRRVVIDWLADNYSLDGYAMVGRC